MTFKELKEGLSGLLDEKSSVELTEKVGKLTAKLEEQEKEVNSLIESNNELRKKYVEAVKNSSFKVEENKPTEKEDEPKTLEECLIEASKSKSK